MAPVTEASDSSTDTGSLTYALEGEQSSRANEGEPLRQRHASGDKLRDRARAGGGGAAVAVGIYIYPIGSSLCLHRGPGSLPKHSVCKG
jgi:hypothetical protein